jgi:hypothetical protein
MSDTKSALVHAQPTDVEHAAKSILDVIARAAADPTVDVAKLERLLDIQRAVLSDQRKIAFMSALSALEADLPQINKAGRVEINGALRSKFARIEDIDTAIRPLCAEHGFAFSFDSKPVGAEIEFSCTMSHRDGHAEVKTITLPKDTGAGRSSVQAVGSTTSYARRYLLSMHLHIITRDEDDDGNGGKGPVSADQAAELRRLLAEAKGSEARFLNWAAAATFEEIPAANYDRCLKFIDEKRRATP